MSGGPTALRRLLEENAAELSQLRSSHIFTAPSGGKRTAVASAAAPGEEREQAEAAPSYHELKDENEALRREVEALKAAFEEANERASTVVRTMRKQDDIRLTLLTAAHDEAMRARDEARVDAAELRMRLEEAKTEMAGLRSRATLHELEAAAEAFSAAHQQPPAPPDEAAAATAAAGAAGVAAAQKDDGNDDEESAAVPPEPSSRVGADAVPQELPAAAPPPPAPPTAILPDASDASRTLLVWSGATSEEAARLTKLEQLAASVSASYEALQAEHAALKRRFGRLQRRRAHERHAEDDGSSSQTSD